MDFCQEIFEKAFDSMPGGFFIYKADGNEEVLYVNRCVLKMFECQTEEEFYALTEGSFRKMVYHEDLKNVERDIQRQINLHRDKFDHICYRIRTKSGKIRRVEDFGRLVTINGIGDIFYVFVIDNDAEYQYYDTDRLTGLPGQKCFIEYAGRALKVASVDGLGEGVAFLYFNILRFKIFNVKYGMQEGDRLLEDIAVILRRNFSNGYVARFSDDHFAVLVEDHDLDNRIEKVFEAIRNLRERTKIQAKVGIYSVKDYSVNPELACDLAKLSCDSIRGNPDVFIERYTDEIGRMIEIQDYVVEHIDQALENHYIQVYYQPVVRAVSGALCGFEALARWIDPEIGFLSPGDFIPALEESRQIHKLDSYMIYEICKNYRRQVDANEEVVPVSFNLSRTDFVACDIGEKIERAVQEFRVPREMINIEITESMFIQDAQRIGHEIDCFHGRGYQVWMDDFGSGYSSLNLLKDFTFDELKIDMGFLSSFTKKSKDILESTVRMAKKIGIQTLAEGVENEEQYQFLRTIGCEKIQGYYFGKPQPYAESMRQCKERGMLIETLAWRRYYDAVGKLDFLTDRPLAVIEDDSRNFRFLFANESFLNSLKSNGTDNLEIAEYNINQTGTVMGRMFRDFARTMSKWNMREHALTYPSGNQYMRINAQVIATCNGRTMVRVNLYNITRQTDEEEQAVRDGIMKNILYLYDDIALEDLDKDVVELFFLSGSGKAGQTQGKRFGIRKIMEKYVKEIIYPEDRDRYLAYADIETLQERILADGRGYLSDYFRTKGADGNYHWLVHTILVVPKSDYRKYLLISKPAPFEDEKVMKSLRRNYGREFISETIPEELEDEIISAGLLWKNLVEYSHINYFWKDKDRRFVGVSQSFLDYYGMKSEDELIGKTDEEMQWHVSDGPYKSDEEQVISEGVYIHDVPGKCIIRGTLHNIAATKMPIYRDGKIVGLIGYFVDLDSQNMSRKALKQISTVDTVTGLNNIRGLIENMVNYIEEYRKNGSDFVVISVEVEEYVRFREAYGEAEGDSLLRMIAGVLLRTFNHAASLGRFSNGIFYIFYRYQDQKDVSDKVKQIREGINDLHRVGDCVCTCFADIHTEYAASSEDVENMIIMLLQKSMEIKKVQKKEDA